MVQSPVSWWKATSSVIMGTLSFVGLAISLTPLFSQGFRDFLKDWWILGWALALAFFFSSAVLFVWGRSLRRVVPSLTADPPAIADPELKRNELSADLSTIEEWLAPFMRHGVARTRLQNIPDPKYFSYDLCRSLDKLGDDFKDSSKELFTPELTEAVKAVETAYTAYWGKLEPLLDAPLEIQDTNWDLKVMTRPAEAGKAKIPASNGTLSTNSSEPSTP